MGSNLIDWLWKNEGQSLKVVVGEDKIEGDDHVKLLILGNESGELFVVDQSIMPAQNPPTVKQHK